MAILTQQIQRSLRRTLTMLVVLILVGGTAEGTVRGLCVGDCNGDCQVTVNELLTAVNIALGNAMVSACTAFANTDGHIPEIADITEAINNALVGCPAGSCTSVCGNGRVEGDEDCDDGGICIGGMNAGTACTGDTQCQGNGVCTEGRKQQYACSADSDCPDGRCVRCKTFGGDGCAANCTLESDVVMPLVPGAIDAGTDLRSGTSGVALHGDILTIPMPLSGGSQAITIGKAGGDGKVPLVIKAANVNVVRRLIVSTLIDGCLRAVSLRTCGGTLFEPDGSESPSCTPSFPGEVRCPDGRPCAFVHGPGNSASGVLACGAEGLPGVDVSLTRDGGGADPNQTQLDLTGSGPQGSALVLNSIAIGSADVPFPGGCADDDPVAIKGSPITLFSTTGMACCEVRNANMLPGNTVGRSCVAGQPLNCAALHGEPLEGGIAGTVAALGLATFGDTCIAMQFFANAHAHEDAHTDTYAER